MSGYILSNDYLTFLYTKDTGLYKFKINRKILDFIIENKCNGIQIDSFDKLVILEDIKNYDKEEV